MSRLIYLTSFFLLFVLLSCSSGKEQKVEDQTNQDIDKFIHAELEKYRPVFHFTPEKNWINDPNGLVFYNDEYHLFYQFNPYGNTWGHMSWGHAVSTDLIRWERLPVALFEENSTMIFSGSAVVDKGNTSGLCANNSGCLLAIYTSHVEETAQYQSIAYSKDQGRNWTKYQHNPVLDIGKKNFRDPKVFWYGPEEKWVMVVSLPLEYKVQFYQSDNLIDWELTGDFGNMGDVSKIWECPDLLRVPVEDSDDNKWVLIISSGSKYGDYTGMQYFTGDFTGERFEADEQSSEPRWIDHGKDFYAAITYNNLSTEVNPILIGWANNWRYANTIPTYPWRGMMSIPRELTLRESEGIFHLIQNPVSSLYTLAGNLGKSSFQDHLIKEEDQLLDDIQAGSFLLKLDIENIDAEEFGIDLLMGDNERTRIGYDVGMGEVFIDREKSSTNIFNDSFTSIESAPVSLQNNRLRLEILVDQSVVEVFAERGLRVITDQVFPTNDENKMRLYAKSGEARVKELDLFKIR